MDVGTYVLTYFCPMQRIELFAKEKNSPIFKWKPEK